MGRVLTQMEFVERAREVHGDLYGFGKAAYVNRDTRGIVICQEHGEFKISPHLLYQGRGCPRCERKSERLERFAKSLQCRTRDDFLFFWLVKFTGTGLITVFLFPVGFMRRGGLYVLGMGSLNRS